MKKIWIALLITLAFSCKKKKTDLDHVRYLGVGDESVLCGDERDNVMTCVSEQHAYLCVAHHKVDGDGCTAGHADYVQCTQAPVAPVAAP
jgi:hypothetical protein